MNESQVNKQHPIPQNFMDVEFKIVGDFTVRQFTYLCVTGFPMYLIYNGVTQGFLKTILLGIFMNESQVNKQHPIPQNFMDVEFKIVGDFTVRQFTYLCVTGFPMYLIYNGVTQGFLKTILLGIFGILGFLLVFVPIDDRGMDVWIVNFFKAVYANNRRVWRKTPIIPKTLSMEAIKLVQGEMITLAPTSSRRKLEEYLKGIEQQEVDEYDFNFNKHKYVSVEEPKEEVQVTLKPEFVMQAAAPSAVSAPKVEIKSIETPAVIIEEAPIVKPEIVQEVIKEEVKVEKPAIQEVVLKIPEIKKVETKPEPIIQPEPQPISFKAPEIKPSQFPILESKPVQAAPVVPKPKPIEAESLFKMPEFKKYIPTKLPQFIKQKEEVIKEEPLKTPDIHEELRTSQADIPGRKFVSFSEEEQELILPIRGERVINIFSKPQEVTPGKDIKSLTRELKTLVREIKKDSTEEEVPSPVSNELINNFISGIIFDPENIPLSEVLLSLIDENGNELKYSRSDTLGKFNFKEIPTGKFKIKVLNPEVFKLSFDIINLNIEKYPYPLIQIIGKKI